MSPINLNRFVGLFLFSNGGEITAHPFIIVNGKIFPAPARGLNFQVSTTVSAGRNANNEVIGQKVGRDQQKIDNLYWPYLSAPMWAEMLQEFEKFEIVVTFPDMVHNNWITLKMYPGDRTATPFKVSKETGLPTDYINCKCNIIDCGLVE